jgi:TolB-like protein/DNA-binding winged helix-turn-helix (wHTH) protein/Tfp pilus assembly protein PilF
MFTTRLPRSVRFADYELDTRAGELRAGNQRVHLQEQPLQILMMLLEHAGEVVTREELHSCLWPGSVFGDLEDNLNHAVRRLRVALGDIAEEPRFIETVPRRGYRFIAVVSEAAPSAAVAGAEGQHADASVLQGMPPQRRRRLAITIAACMVALGLVIVLNSADLRTRLGRAVGALREPRLQVHSLAVLPLENLSHDPAQEYFADGMTDELITDLSKITSLHVISRTSVMGYKGTKSSLPQIGRELNVDAVLEGTVLKQGDRIRITAQLLHAPMDRHLWAQSYEGDLRDVLTLQDDVARDIASQIKARLTPQEQTRLTSTRAVSPDAQDAYFRARFSMSSFTPDATKEAIRYYQQAIAKDPNYALAYAGLADAYFMLGQPLAEGSAAESRALFRQAKAAAAKGVELDDHLAEAHTVLGLAVMFNDWDWTGAAGEFHRALDLAPNSADAHCDYAIYLMSLARSQESLVELRRCIELDPLSITRKTMLGEAFLYAHEYDLAIEQLQNTLKLDPNFVRAHDVLSWTYHAKGMIPEDFAESRKVLTLSGAKPEEIAAFDHAYAEGGMRGLERWSLARPGTPRPTLVAYAYACLDEKDRAFSYLEKAYRERDGELLFMRVNPCLDGLRGDPRFQDLLRRMNFPP